MARARRKGCTQCKADSLDFMANARAHREGLFVGFPGRCYRRYGLSTSSKVAIKLLPKSGLGDTPISGHR